MCGVARDNDSVSDDSRHCGFFYHSSPLICIYLNPKKRNRLKDDRSWVEVIIPPHEVNNDRAASYQDFVRTVILTLCILFGILILLDF